MHEQVEQSSVEGAEKDKGIKQIRDTSISMQWHNLDLQELQLISNGLTRIYLAMWEVEFTNWTHKAVNVVQGPCRLHLSHAIQLTAAPGHYIVQHFTFLIHLKHKAGVFTLKPTSMKALKPVVQKTLKNLKSKIWLDFKL